MFKKISLLILSFLLIFQLSCDDSIYTPYLLPNTHPLYKKLDKYFKHPSMFDSCLDLQSKGFKVINTQMPWSIMVFKNKSTGNYLLKKYSNKKSVSDQNENYIKRINNANIIRDFAAARDLHLIKAAKKWLYPLPEQFADPVTHEPSFVLVVENMKPISHRKNSRRYRRMRREPLRQLCITLHDLGGCDAMSFNQPFNKMGQIIFVDTEHLGRTTGDFMGRVVPRYFNKETQDYVTELWNSL